jgi:hypothetical protein
VGNDSHIGGQHAEFANDHGVQTSVDIPSLEAEVSRLESLRDYVANTLIPHLSEVSTTIKDNGVAFGTFGKAKELAQKHDGYLQAVAQGYADVVKQLDDDVTATRAIIEKYRTAEARNAANLQDIEAIFAKGGSAAAVSSTTSTSTGTTGGSGL